MVEVAACMMGACGLGAAGWEAGCWWVGAGGWYGGGDGLTHVAVGWGLDGGAGG